MTSDPRAPGAPTPHHQQYECMRCGVQVEDMEAHECEARCELCGFPRDEPAPRLGCPGHVGGTYELPSRSEGGLCVQVMRDGLLCGKGPQFWEHMFRNGHDFISEREGGPSELSRIEELRFAMRAACVHESWSELETVLEETYDLIETRDDLSARPPVPPPLETGEANGWLGFDEAYTSFWTGWLETHPSYMTPATYPSFRAGWKAGRAPLERQVEEQASLIRSLTAAGEVDGRTRLLAALQERDEALREIAADWMHEGSPASFCPHCVAERALVSDSGGEG
jgi:ribosomal protein L37E